MMAMTWTKLKLAAAVFFAAASLPAQRALAAEYRKAKPRIPINRTLAAMRDNTWLKLPTPRVHPVCRSSSPWMPYVPEAGVGILWGCSHAGYHNDVWTYDLARNVWKEMLKTEPSAAKDPDVLKYKDGALMTRDGRPLSFHQWGRMDYDPDRRVLWHLGGGWQGVYGIAAHYKKIGKKIRQEGDPEKHKRLRAKGPALWQYSLKTNKWKLVYTEDPTRCARHIGYIRYFPALKKLIMTPCIVSPNEDRENFKIYDPATNRWEGLKVAWKAIDQDVSRYWVYGNSPIVYDAKRKVLVLIFGKGGTWLLDPVRRTMTQVVAKEKSLPANLDGPMGAYVYDSAGEATLGLFLNYTQYNSGKVLKARGFPADRASVWVLDVEKKKWTLQPKPADGVLPPLNRLGNLHHFYDPVENATMIFRGGYNRANGEVWVYRYRRARR